jgi:hypothetical protein
MRGHRLRGSCILLLTCSAIETVDPGDVRPWDEVAIDMGLLNLALRVSFASARFMVRFQALHAMADSLSPERTFGHS